MAQLKFKNLKGQLRMLCYFHREKLYFLFSIGSLTALCLFQFTISLYLCFQILEIKRDYVLIKFLGIKILKLFTNQ